MCWISQALLELSSGKPFKCSVKVCGLELVETGEIGGRHQLSLSELGCRLRGLGGLF